MTFSAEDFISPVGNMTGEMFPGEVLENRVQSVLDTITDAVGSSLTGDQLEMAIYHGVYARLYEAASSVVIPAPVLGTLVDQATMQWATNRSQQYLVLAAKHQGLYDAAFATPSSAPARYPSGAVPTRITAP